MSYIKDLAYILLLIVTVTATLMTFKNRVANLETEVKKLYRIIFKKNGELGVVTHETCLAHRTIISKETDDINSQLTKTFDKLDTMNDNIILLMVHMNVTPQQRKEPKDG